MAVINNHLQLGTSIVLDATDEFTHVAEVAGGAGLVDITLEFDGSWSGTIRFDRASKIDGAWVYDPITCTNLNGGSTATTTTGGTSAVENWRVDASGGGVRVYAQAVAGGQCEVTLRVSEG